MRLTTWLVAASLATAAAAGFARSEGAQVRAVAADPVEVTCTFENRAYAGGCVETTTREASQAPETACQPILECLNDPRCPKTYCRATSIRQGWTLKAAR